MKDTEIFKGTQLSHVLKDSYDLSALRREKIADFIRLLTNLIKNVDDATLLAPILKDFYDILIKNDDTLVKIATVVQRIISADAYSNKDTKEDVYSILSPEEKQQLLSNLNDIQEANKVVESSTSETESKLKDILENML